MPAQNSRLRSLTQSGSSLFLSLKRSLSEVTRRASQRMRIGGGAAAAALVNEADVPEDEQENEQETGLLRNSEVAQGLDEDDEIFEEEKVEDD